MPDGPYILIVTAVNDKMDFFCPRFPEYLVDSSPDILQAVVLKTKRLLFVSPIGNLLHVNLVEAVGGILCFYARIARANASALCDGRTQLVW